MNAITRIESPVTFTEMERLAESIAKSNLFGMKTKEQALALMAISQAEGRHPALAARDYDIIQGRSAKKAEAMMRDYLESGGKVEWHALSDTIADATFSHPAGGTVRIDWNEQRAKTAGLAGKDMYKKYPRQMLRSRCISEGVRTVCPAATSGMYVPEEVADFEPRGQATVISPPLSAPKLTPPPAPKSLSEAEERQLDREAMRNGMGETKDDVIDPETGEVIEEAAPAPDKAKMIAWAQKAIIAINGVQTEAEFDRLYSLKFRDAIKQLGSMDEKLQDDLVAACNAQMARFAP